MLSVYTRRPVATGESTDPSTAQWQLPSSVMPCSFLTLFPVFLLPWLLQPVIISSFPLCSRLTVTPPHVLLPLTWAFSIEEALCLLSVCLDAHRELHLMDRNIGYVFVLITNRSWPVPTLHVHSSALPIVSTTYLALVFSWMVQSWQ